MDINSYVRTVATIGLACPIVEKNTIFVGGIPTVGAYSIDEMGFLLLVMTPHRLMVP